MKNKYGKLTLFMAIITVLFLLTALITQIDFFDFITFIAFILTLAIGVVWLSNLIFGKIKYSKNLIVCLALLVLTLIIWPFAASVESPYISVVFAVSILAFVVSVIVYVGRLIFVNDDKKNETSIPTNTTIIASTQVAETKGSEDTQR